MKNITISTLAMALLLPLSACSPSGQGNSSSASANQAAQATSNVTQPPSHSMISGVVQKAMQAAKQKLNTENIDLNNIHIDGSRVAGSDSLPKAEITPQGELLIGGKPMVATPAQQTLLLNYRQQIVGIAEAGMDIGTQGADLGVSAAKTAIWGALAGKSDKDIDAAIQPQTAQIQAAAIKLCQRLPDLLSSQQSLAAAMPAFKPYATMQQKDIDDCGKNMTDKNGKKGFAIFSD